MLAKMKKKIIYTFCILVGLSIVVASLVPAGTNPNTVRFLENRMALQSSGFWLNKYAQDNGRYPEDLSVFKDVPLWERREALLPYLDPALTLYCRPDTSKPSKNFVLLVRPFNKLVFIVFADGSMKIVDSQKGIIGTYGAEKSNRQEVKLRPVRS